jgi:hypothetical protein
VTRTQTIAAHGFPERQTGIGGCTRRLLPAPDREKLQACGKQPLQVLVE